MTYPFTVLLLRPDYLADAFGQDTYLAFVCVEHDDPDQAWRAAQREAVAKESHENDALHAGPDDGLDDHLDDYYPLFVCRGHVANLA